MDKTELTSCIAEKAGLTKEQAACFMKALTACIIETLSKGETVRITGLCTFEMRQYASRCGRDLNRKTPLDIPQRSLPICRMSDSAKKALLRATYTAAEDQEQQKPIKNEE